MFFNSKTKRWSGKLERASHAEIEEERRLVAAGRLISTAHPSDEELAKINAIFAQSDVQAELDAIDKMLEKRRGGHG